MISVIAMSFSRHPNYWLPGITTLGPQTEPTYLTKQEKEQNARSSAADNEPVVDL